MGKKKTRKVRAAYRMKALTEAEADGLSIIKFTGDGPAVIGPNKGLPDLICGSCGNVLLTGVARARYINLIFWCKPCGAYNDTGDATVN